MPKHLGKVLTSSCSESPPRKRVKPLSQDKEQLFADISLELKTTSVPPVSQFRTDEKKQILTFIEENLSGKSESSTMIVFGQPGLGKTLVLKEVTRDLSEKGESSDSSAKGVRGSRCKASAHYVNAMNYTNCSRFVEDLANKFGAAETRPGTQYRLEALKKCLTERVETRPVLLIIDELETLSFHESDFTFVFDLLSICIPGFVKICISNTVELFTPTQDKGVVYLAFKFLVFKPYDTKQLKGVLVQRLRNAGGEPALEAWPDSTVEFLVKKTITSRASDVRFVLTCAQEITEQKLLQKDFAPVTIAEVIAFFDQKLKTNLAEVVQRLSYQAQVLLMAIYDKLRSSQDFLLLDELSKKFYEILEILGLGASERIPELLEMLEMYNLVKVEQKGTRTKRVKIVRLCMMREELEHLLRKISLFERFFARAPAI